MEKYLNEKDVEILKGILGEHVEVREQQLTLIDKIRDCIAEPGGRLIGEAPPGTGKSLSYLIPCAQYILNRRTKKDAEGDKESDGKSESKRKIKKNRIIISTQTKTLQQQLIQKDIPSLNKYLESKQIEPIVCSVFYGAENYVCWKRLFDLQKYYELMNNKEGSTWVDEAIRWANMSGKGLRGEIENEKIEKEWEEINRKREICLKGQCPYIKKCFYYGAWKQMRERSEMTIVNHHLFMNDLSKGNIILGDYDVFIGDEAHSIPDVARDQIGYELYIHRNIQYFLNKIVGKKGMLNHMVTDGMPSRTVGNCSMEAEEVRKAAEELFADLKKLFEGTKEKKNTLRVKKGDSLPDNKLGMAIYRIRESLTTIGEESQNALISSEAKSLAGTALEYENILSSFLESEQDEERVYWVSYDAADDKGKRKEEITITCMPVSLKGVLDVQLFDDKEKSIVLVSATLTTTKKGGFDFFKDDIAIKEAKEIALTSPFDYKTQALLYLPENAVRPDSPGYEEYVAREYIKLVEINELIKGGTLALFTSYETMHKVYEIVKRLSEIDPMVQGIVSRYHIIEKMKSELGSAAMGTKSMGSGVDIPGKNLSMLLVTRLPFPVPDNPLFEARVQRCRKMGKNPFMDLAIPLTIIEFRQYVGRLIRSLRDKGVIAVLDPRIIEKSYGQKFMFYLKDCELTRSIERVKEFILTCDDVK